MEKSQQNTKLIIAATIGILLLITVIAVIAFLDWPNPKEPITPNPTTSFTQLTSNEATEESNLFEYSSTLYPFKFKYPKEMGQTLSSSFSSTSTCNDDKKTESISFQKSSLIVYVHNCASSSGISAKIIERYTLTDKKGEEYSVVIFQDAFTKDLQHLRLYYKGEQDVNFTGQAYTNVEGKEKMSELKEKVKTVVDNIEFSSN